MVDSINWLLLLNGQYKQGSVNSYQILSVCRSSTMYVMHRTPLHIKSLCIIMARASGGGGVQIICTKLGECKNRKNPIFSFCLQPW